MSEEAGKPSVDDPDYPWYTVAQATELLGVNPPTLRRWEREGLVSPQRTEGGQRRYSRRELQQLDQVAQLADEGVTTVGIRKILQLRDRVGQLEDELAVAREPTEPPPEPPER
jgi:MerR family transcriptional regulator, heat shock protein HspR